MNISLKRIMHLGFIAGCLALSGCYTRPTYEPKVPHVREESLSHMVLFNDGAVRMNPAERDALKDFVSTVSPSAVTNISLESGDMNPRAMARAGSVRNFLVARGFDKKLFHVKASSAAGARAVLLTIEYAEAVSPKNCPDWSAEASDDYYNKDESSNFGCAYNNNLVQQLANPADYNGGHGQPVFDAARDSVYLQRYTAGAALPSSSVAGSASSGASGASTGASSASTGTGQ